MINRWILGANLALGLFYATTAHAQNIQFVLPDDQFVKTECNALRKSAATYLPNSLSEVETICAALKNKQISTDEWIARIDPVARKIDSSIPCPYCLRSFLPKREPVPQGFSTYVLALLPSPQLDNPDWVWAFKEKFDAFGGSIGDNQLAIWLGRRYGNYIDIDRSKYYCDRLGLNYNDGPYIVVTSIRPDLYQKDDEAVFVKLAGISKDRVLRVMNVLEQDLRQEREIRKRALLFEEVKQKLLSASERNSDALKDVVVSWLKK